MKRKLADKPGPFICEIDGYYDSLRAIELAMEDFVWSTDGGKTRDDLTISLRRVNDLCTVTIEIGTPSVPRT